MNSKKAIFSTFQAEVSFLHPMLEWVTSHLKKEGVPSDQIRKVEIALEEVFINIIYHGYPSQKGTIEIGFCFSKERVGEFIIKDKGIPFDPTKKIRSFKPFDSLDEAKIGGYGIPLVYAFMDEIEYRREGEMNILILKKKFY